MGEVVILVVAGVAAQLFDLRGGVVGVGRGKVRQHLGAVDALPRERVVSRGVESIPRELLGQEPVDPGAAHDLWQLAVIPEHVGVPELAVPAAELALEEPLAIQELAHERLPRGQIAIGLDPGAADRHPLARSRPMPDAVIQVGVVPPHPVVLIGLRAAEPKLRVPGHVGGLRAEASHQLSMRLLERPKPRGVDMGMADRRQLVHNRAVSPQQQPLEDVGGLVPGTAIGFDPDVAEAVELGQQLARPGRIQPVDGVGLQPAQHVEVVVKLPGLLVEARNLTAVEHHRLDGAVAPVHLPELAVACELDPQVEMLAAGGVLNQQRVGPRPLVAGVEALDRPAVDPQRGLAVGDPQQVDALSRPLRRHGGLHLKPEGCPQRPELLAQPGVAVGQRLGLIDRDAVDRPRHHQPVGVARVGIDQRLDPLADLGDAGARVDGMAQHRPGVSPA